MKNNKRIGERIGEYYIGLDIGTSSVGWAVTDTNYKVPKFKGKGMWGVRLFDEAKTAKERRIYRGARRRNARETQRIKLLQELFAEEISKVDFGFFMRLKESPLYFEDKSENQPNALFNDPEFNDKDYNKLYPTIYHLRKDLMINKDPHDIRLVYLAIHHILKHRGHFLYSGMFSDVSDLKVGPMLDDLSMAVKDYCDFDLTCTDKGAVADILKGRSGKISDKKKVFKESFVFDDNRSRQAKEILALMAGGSVSLSVIFDDNSYEEDENNKIKLSDNSYEEKEESYRALLQDRIALLEQVKRIFDWGILQDVLNGQKSISYAKVKTFETHKNDLAMLKKAIMEYCPEKYDEVFRDQQGKGHNNYSAYIGNYRNKGKHRIIENKCTQGEFCEYLKKKILNLDKIDAEKYPDLVIKIESGTLVPKQKVKDNSVIPYQVNEQELKKILENAEAYLPFLAKRDADGLSATDKILSIMTFRIPYYVGPINLAHIEEGEGGHAWAVKKSSIPVRPWNFEEVIDKEESARKFIKRMTNKCTYLTQEDVLAKNSLLYSKFMVLNELNNLTLDGEKVSVELKQLIYHDLFENKRRVTGKMLKDFLKRNGSIKDNEEVKIGGFENNFKSSLSSYLDFRNILGKNVFSDDEYAMIEKVIEHILLFGEDRKMLRSMIEREYGDILNPDQIRQICKLKYSGWGRLSKKLLTEITEVDPKTGEVGEASIIEALFSYYGNPNFMELLSNDYGFSVGIAHNKSDGDSHLEVLRYEDLKDLYVSVPVKRSIWQTVTIVKELVKLIGHEPKKIFIEMTRGKENKPVRRDSRKEELLSLYKTCVEESSEIFNSLKNEDSNKLRSDKLFLYYKQLGKCMYSGTKIELSEMNDYDIDHIYPQSKVMDDSLDNRVLVKKTLNGKKSDHYPLPAEWQSKMSSFWRMLAANGAISEKKLKRLERKEAFSEGELVGFVSRQIVETAQSTKAVAHLFERLYMNTEVVYVKAGNVSRFRQGVDDLATGRTRIEIEERKKENEFIKVRDINDYHHAKDAYLNIVVGNVFNSKFTSNPYKFFAGKNNEYSLNAMYKFPVTRGGVTAWMPTDKEHEGTMATVRNMMAKNNIQFTRYAYEAHGGFFDQQIVKKGKGQMSKKSSGALSDIGKYGGYNKVSGAYFFLVEHLDKKDKKIRTIEFVPVYMIKKIDQEHKALMEYCKSELKLNEPRILISKIKIDALFELNGFRMHLSGRGDTRLLFKNANELILTYEEEKYAKALVKFDVRLKNNTAVKVTQNDGISKDNNLELLKSLLKKICGHPFNLQMGYVSDVLDINKFISLTVEDQVKALVNIIPLFRCNAETADLKLISQTNKSRVIRIQKNISKQKGLYIINQSPTGLFEQKIDLLKI